MARILSAMPPQFWLALTSFVGLLAALAATWIALSIEVPSRPLGTVSTVITLDGRPLETFLLEDGTQIEARAVVMLEEPDVLPTWGEFNQFMVDQGALAAAMAQGGITVVWRDGQQEYLPAVPRTLGMLPVGYWMQLLFGLVGLLLGSGIWAFKPNDAATRLYAFTGACFALSAITAAVYSTRQLALDDAMFRSLSHLNHFGALAFAGALLGLLWHYPKPLSPWPMGRVALGTALVFWIIDATQIGPKSVTGMQTGILLLFAPCFVVAAIQWKRHARRPVERAALMWFLLSIFSGTLLFAGLVLLPPIFGAPPLAEQSLMFGVFLLIYSGIAAALTRYRLFDIERWWFGAWLWFLGGLAIVAVDALLLMALPIAGATAALFAVAIIGWIYFPVRQWLWRRLLPDRQERVAALLPNFASRIASARTAQEMPEIWREQLLEAFDPLSIHTPAASQNRLHISDDGQILNLPATEHLPAISLQHARKGARLFSTEDRELAAALLSLADHSTRTIASRQRDVEEERQRIMRDLHDDLGSKLLAISHTGEQKTQQIARAALQDLRDILRALDMGPSTLGELMDNCRFELSGRADAHGFKFDYRTEEVDRAVPVSAREAANIDRLLREAVTNAVRHGQCTLISVAWQLIKGQLTITIEQNGVVTDPSTWRPGRGLRSQKSRAADLGGAVEWQAALNGGCTTHLRLTLQAAA